MPDGSRSSTRIFPLAAPRIYITRQSAEARFGHEADPVVNSAELWATDPGRLDEILEFSGDLRGMAVALERDEVGVVLLDSDRTVSAGDEVRGTGQVVRVPV